MAKFNNGSKSECGVKVRYHVVHELVRYRLGGKKKDPDQQVRIKTQKLWKNSPNDLQKD